MTAPHRSALGLAFVGPFLILYVALVLLPVGYGAWLSLNAIDLLSNIGGFVGLGNFVALAQDENFQRVVINTLLFGLFFTPLCVSLGLALALALNRPGRFASLLRGLLFGASVLSVTLVTLIWKLVLMPERGLLAGVLGAAGLPTVAPLNDELLALPTVALVTLWWVIGLPMMLFLAALQQIPQEVYEAAKLDNATPWRVLTRITLPAIRRTVVLVAITQLIGALQVFGQVQLMTLGGPNNATRPIVMFVFEAMFDQWALGYAAAAAQVLFAVLLLCLGLQRWAERKVDA